MKEGWVLFLLSWGGFLRFGVLMRGSNCDNCKGNDLPLLCASLRRWYLRVRVLKRYV